MQVNGFLLSDNVLVVISIVMSISNIDQNLENALMTTRQKRKLDEMYDLARTEIESFKRSAIQPLNHSFSRQDPDLFSNPSARMDNRDSIRKGQHYPVEIISSYKIDHV